MSDELGQAMFREKPDISMVFIRQLDRTNLVASMTYQDAINQILANLPTQWRTWVYDQEDTYKTVEATLLFKKFSGRRQGSRNDPLLKNPKIPVKRYEDGSVDWTDSNITSPILKELTKIDYQKFNELVMDAAQAAGLTWNIEAVEVDAGDTKEQVEHIKRIRTPFLPYKEFGQDLEIQESLKELDDIEQKGD